MTTVVPLIATVFFVIAAQLRKDSAIGWIRSVETREEQLVSLAHQMHETALLLGILIIAHAYIGT